VSKERELLRRLASGDNKGDFFISNELLKEIQQLLAQHEQTEQEPVAWMCNLMGHVVICKPNVNNGDTPLYTAPPKREPLTPRQGLEEYKRGYAKAELDLRREPLSDERLRDLSNSINDYPDFGNVSVWQAFYISRLIEKAHGIGGGE